MEPKISFGRDRNLLEKQLNVANWPITGPIADEALRFVASKILSIDDGRYQLALKDLKNASYTDEVDELVFSVDGDNDTPLELCIKELKKNEPSKGTFSSVIMRPLPRHFVLVLVAAYIRSKRPFLIGEAFRMGLLNLEGFKSFVVTEIGSEAYSSYVEAYASSVRIALPNENSIVLFEDCQIELTSLGYSKTNLLKIIQFASLDTMRRVIVVENKLDSEDDFMELAFPIMKQESDKPDGAYFATKQEVEYYRNLYQYTHWEHFQIILNHWGIDYDSQNYSVVDLGRFSDLINNPAGNKNQDRIVRCLKSIYLVQGQSVEQQFYDFLTTHCTNLNRDEKPCTTWRKTHFSHP